MGAENFETLASGKDAAAAFANARADARYDHGNRGYTGTIAEKDDYRMLETKIASDDPEPMKAARRLAAALGRNHWSENKWGPAACIQVGPNPRVPGETLFLFFGVASS